MSPAPGIAGRTGAPPITGRHRDRPAEHANTREGGGRAPPTHAPATSCPSPSNPDGAFPLRTGSAPTANPCCSPTPSARSWRFWPRSIRTCSTRLDHRRERPKPCSVNGSGRGSGSGSRPPAPSRRRSRPACRSGGWGRPRAGARAPGPRPSHARPGVGWGGPPRPVLLEQVDAPLHGVAVPVGHPSKAGGLPPAEPWRSRCSRWSRGSAIVALILRRLRCSRSARLE